MTEHSLFSDRHASNDRVFKYGYGHPQSVKADKRKTELVISSMLARGYRTFPKFQMEDLGRINLLVGRNNSGKTSLLEGLYILASGMSVGAIWQILVNRGEIITPYQMPGIATSPEVSVCHLFCGHKITPGAEFILSTTNNSPREIKFTIVEAKPGNSEQNQLFDAAGESPSPKLSLQILLSGAQAPIVLPLTYTETVRLDVLQNFYNFSLQQKEKKSGEAQYLTTDSLNASQVAQSLNEIVLTNDEHRVIEALQLLEPRLERIAAVPISFAPMPGQPYSVLTKSGVFIKLKGNDNRLPIGSFGEGTWRIFAIAIAMVKARNSVLLIDEIDNGLHFSAMKDMWELIAKSAEQLNVQVFATTHNSDCVRSFASICNPASHNRNSAVTMQRIEYGKEKSIPFSEEEIVSAAENNIEIR